MVRAHSLNWEEERAIVDRPFFIRQIRSRLAGSRGQSVRTNKQASTTTNQFVYWPLKLVSRCACLYGINCIECICVVRSARDNTIEPNYTLFIN